MIREVPRGGDELHLDFFISVPDVGRNSPWRQGKGQRGAVGHVVQRGVMPERRDGLHRLVVEAHDEGDALRAPPVLALVVRNAGHLGDECLLELIGYQRAPGTGICDSGYGFFL
jgi:hypothetical protein